jgi:hypothetical protein
LLENPPFYPTTEIGVERVNETADPCIVTQATSGSFPIFSNHTPGEFVVTSTGKVIGIGAPQTLPWEVRVTSVMDDPSAEKLYARL